MLLPQQQHVASVPGEGVLKLTFRLDVELMSQCRRVVVEAQSLLIQAQAQFLIFEGAKKTLIESSALQQGLPGHRTVGIHFGVSWPLALQPSASLGEEALHLRLVPPGHQRLGRLRSDQHKACDHAVGRFAVRGYMLGQQPAIGYQVVIEKKHDVTAGRAQARVARRRLPLVRLGKRPEAALGTE